MLTFTEIYDKYRSKNLSEDSTVLYEETFKYIRKINR